MTTFNFIHFSASPLIATNQTIRPIRTTHMTSRSIDKILSYFVFRHLSGLLPCMLSWRQSLDMSCCFPYATYMVHRAFVAPRIRVHAWLYTVQALVNMRCKMTKPESTHGVSGTRGTG